MKFLKITKMNKQTKLIILIISLFITLPLSGFLFSIKPLLGLAVYLTQIGTSVNLLSEWYKYQK
jgi:hypothetical protein